MKKLAFAAAAIVAFVAAPAQAADLGRSFQPTPAYAAPPMLWNGFYIGGHVGYGWGESSASYLGLGLSPTPSPDGIFGGGQIGYNFQFSPNWVIGVEADAAFADFSDSVSIAGFSGKSTMDSFGTIRGRLGYAFNNVLFYGTGGFAWGNNELSVSPAPFGVSSDSRWHTGYAIGGGLEYAFSPSWSAKIEYLYLDFGRQDYNFNLGSPVSYETQMHTVKLGVNYRFNWGQ